MGSKLKNSGRRAFLQGVGGVTLGLPLLEYTHGRAWAATGSAKRVVVVLNHGGETMCVNKDGSLGGSPQPSWGLDMPSIDHWLPKPGSRFGIAHEIFEGTDIWDKMIVARGIDNRVCTTGRYGGDHTLSNASVLTARKTKCSNGGSTAGGKCSEESDEVATGPSIDWVLAQRLQAKYGGRSTPYSLIVPGHFYGTGFYWGANGEQKTTGEHDPRAAFDALFSGVMSTGPDPSIARKQQLEKSQLNGVMDAYRRFSQKLGMQDKQIVDAHLQHISELEKQIMGIEVTAECIVPNRPAAFSDWYAASANPETVGPLHAQLIVAAMRCGLTHVANLEIADFLTPWAPSGLQVESAFDVGHSLGHWITDLPDKPQYIDAWELEMKENRAWRMGLVKTIAEGLDSIPEGDGTMLDNSVVFYTNEFSTGGIHSSTDGPYMFIGSAGGYFNTGRYVELSSKRQANPSSLEGGGNTYATNNVYTSLLRAIGENDSGFGDMSLAKVSGPISELT